ncbi:MAG TPA: TIGR03435 family protein [Vicinamibacterales bacterium]|jgi:uncharacterized protein (TIGR03435 family)
MTGHFRVMLASCVAIVVVANALPTASVRAQSTGEAPGPRFTIVSIKQNKSATVRPRVGFRPGSRFEAIAATVQDLIALAYGGGQGIRRSQIVDAPRWTESERFDIRAQVEDGTGPAPAVPPDLMLQMLQNLLADRLKLVAHRDRREQPIYALTLLRPDGTLGPQLRRADADCDSRVARIPPDVKQRPLVCGMEGGLGRARGQTMRIADFAARQLSSILDRQVVDRTALEGIFDWELQWAPAPGELAPLGSDDPPPSPDGPSIFKALEEQLGLKLVTERGLVDVVVVDSISRPTPD